jgi:hypothetical protein
LAGALLVGIISCKPGPVRKNAVEIASKLTDLKTGCESNVQALKQKGIDGRTKYEKAQQASNSCISYLTTALRSRGSSAAFQVRPNQCPCISSYLLCKDRSNG